MENKNQNLAINDKVEIQITGRVKKYLAQVIGFDNCSPNPHPQLRVINNPNWDKFILKDGDYIILSRK